MSGSSAPDEDARLRRKERLELINREAAEVYLLLDFLSGVDDRSLRPTKDEQFHSFMRGQADKSTQPVEPDAATQKAQKFCADIEADLADPTRLVVRTMRISYPVQQGDDDFEANAAFLVRARDVLNTRAVPATGQTIAFTAMVAAARELPVSTSSPPNNERLEIHDFAERAYPRLRDEAARLTRSTSRALRLLILILGLALLVSAYTAWGKVLLDTLDAVRRDGGTTREQVYAANASNKAETPKTLPTATATPPDPSPAQLGTGAARIPCPRASNPALCDRLDDLGQREEAIYRQLEKWQCPSRFLPCSHETLDEGARRRGIEQWATALMAICANHVLPIIYALMGSIAFVLRRHHDRLAASLLTPRDLRSNRIRLLLGLVIGASIGLICSGSDLVHTQGMLGASATLTTSAIAFLAGYGVEGVFKTLDALVLQIFKVNGAEHPPQSAS